MSVESLAVQVPRLCQQGHALVPEAPCDPEAWSQLLGSVLGLKNPDLAVQLVTTALNAIPAEGSNKAQLANMLIASIAELSPRDGVEAILAVQAVVTHVTALSMLQKANATNLTGLAELRFKLAEKLIKLSTQQLRALDGHRRQGQQHVRVEHVHIHEGAQAIVGTVQTRGVI